MLFIRSIVGTALGLIFLMALAACGQKGPLFLPTEPAATNRATLPQTLNPARRAASSPASVSPAPASSAPSAQ